MNAFFELVKNEPLRLLPLWLALMSAVLFCVMGADKGRAKAGARRVPEKTLFLLALIGGAVGGVLGMRVFRHKTKHWYFAWGFPILALLQLGLCFWLLRGGGA
ncbi:MAG: DUF1294 domain-containing protein [Clostridia bacterium]